MSSSFTYDYQSEQQRLELFLILDLKPKSILKSILAFLWIFIENSYSFIRQLITKGVAKFRYSLTQLKQWIFEEDKKDGQETPLAKEEERVKVEPSIVVSAEDTTFKRNLDRFEKLHKTFKENQEEKRRFHQRSLQIINGLLPQISSSSLAGDIHTTKHKTAILRRLVKQGWFSTEELEKYESFAQKAEALCQQKHEALRRATDTEP